MNRYKGVRINRSILLLLAIVVMALTAIPASAAGYDNSLNDVKDYKVVYDVSLGDPKIANLIFWAVKNSYEAPEVKALGKPQVAIVFHGPAVKLLSTDSDPFNAAEREEVNEFQQTLRQMKKDGVKLEVCNYALNVVGVDKATVIKEIDVVDNGFVSIIGYQLQGYALVDL